MPGQTFRLRHPPRCAANEQHIGAPAAPLGHLPQSDQRFPLRLGCCGLCRRLLRYRNRNAARPERFRCHPHLPRRRLSARCVMNQLMPGVSNYIDSVLVIISDLCCEVIAAPSLAGSIRTVRKRSTFLLFRTRPCRIDIANTFRECEEHTRVGLGTHCVDKKKLTWVSSVEAGTDSPPPTRYLP